MERIIIPEDIFNLYFVGDIHGDFQSIKNKTKDFTNTCFIFCGDIGVGFSDTPLRKFKGFIDKIIFPFLKKRNNMFICIRGNHDNPDYFSQQYVQNSRFILVKDYTVISFKDKNILSIGGGLSIDRVRRQVGKSYWVNEMPVFDQRKIDQIMGELNINVIATHTAPSFVALKDKGEIITYYSVFDVNLLDDCVLERKIMDNIYNYISEKQSIEYWYYGHFHNSFNEKYKETTFIGLNIEEIKKLN